MTEHEARNTHVHDWRIWPETNGTQQKCMGCGSFRFTPDDELPASMYGLVNGPKNPAVEPLEIVEEVPEVTPHWYVSGIVKPFRAESTPHFDTHAGAVAFCEALGRTHVTRYFEP